MHKSLWNETENQDRQILHKRSIVNAVIFTLPKLVTIDYKNDYTSNITYSYFNLSKEMTNKEIEITRFSEVEYSQTCRWGHLC